jgi:hypothetical protein
MLSVFDPEDGGIIFLLNISCLSEDCMALCSALFRNSHAHLYFLNIEAVVVI